MESILVKLPAPTLVMLHKIADQENVTAGQILRDAVTRDLYRRERTKSPKQRQAASLRALVGDDFAFSADWGELRRRLLAKGYVLRETAGGLFLHETKSGKQICESSEIGYGYAQMMRKFQHPFPEHSDNWLSDRSVKTAVGRV